MTNLQLLTIALSLIIPISALLYSNSRINEAKKMLGSEIKTTTTEIAADLARLATELQSLKTNC